MKRSEAGQKPLTDRTRFALLFLIFIIAACLFSNAMAAEPLEVAVEGIEGDALKNVQAALAFPPGMVREGVIDQALLNLFRRRLPEKIQKSLEPFGFYEAQASSIVEKTEDGRDLLLVKVIPGAPVRVTSVQVKVTGPGEKNRDLTQLAASFPLKSGDVLNQVKYEKAKEELRSRALNLGYLGADFVSHVIRVNRTERKAEIELILQTGPAYLFGEVIWEGPQMYPISYLERYLDFKPGEPYSYSKVYQTQLNLINSDRFSSVNIRADKDEAREARVPVRVQLEPSAPKRLRPGVGYSTDYGAKVMLRYQDLNAFQRGHEFNADMSIAERQQAVSAYYTLPNRGHIDNRTNLKAGLQREILNPYDNVLLTLEGEQARSFGYGIIGSAYLQFRYEQFSEADRDGISELLMPGLRLYQRRVDDLIRPSRGFRYSLETRGSTRTLGAESDFLQFLANGDLLIPLGAGFSLIPRTQLGATWQKDPLTDLPPSLRFYAGGDRSVRGYTYQSLGPKDSQGNVIGGKHLLVGSLELEYFITKNWSVAGFYDAGNAFNNFQDMTWPMGAGLGIRYYTPAGPVRVDVARQINVDNPGFQLHIAVGFAL
ncbi:MAG: autotransporter secretion outer membrane protein TamA [Deltaproteobacteria bacterium]|nr:autotransporter secretion outer membrane protein TamA [Deltaproteobacteria bacterium]